MWGGGGKGERERKNEVVLKTSWNPTNASNETASYPPKEEKIYIWHLKPTKIKLYYISKTKARPKKVKIFSQK